MSEIYIGFVNSFWPETGKTSDTVVLVIFPQFLQCMLWELREIVMNAHSIYYMKK